MAKVVGIGETILDIIFKNEQPVAAKPGGSTFNTLVSLARKQISTEFISEIGKDHAGALILQFMQKDEMSTQYMVQHSQQTPLSLAFLDEKNDAVYQFYGNKKNCFAPLIDVEFTSEDFLLLGSFYAIHAITRPRVFHLLHQAQEAGAFIYYDPNFRVAHLADLSEVKKNIIQNIQAATVVRGSNEDFNNIFGTSNLDETYQALSILGKPTVLIYTCGENGVYLKTPSISLHVASMKLEVLSTIGAGDSFNAGFLWKSFQMKIKKEQLDTLSEDAWKALLKCGIDFASEVCMSYENYIQ